MGIKILLADDSITIQKVIGIIFGGEEYSLTVVDNGKAAVEKARELNPDVLLIDALMPGMTGYEVCEAVRAIPALATKPILILTGSFEPFDEDKAKKCGADDYLAKPFESQQIVNKVKELAELGSSRLANVAAKPQSTAPEPVPVPAFTAPAESVAAAAPQTVPEAPQTPADIWGAFTPEVEPAAVAAVAATPPAAIVSNAFEPDVFAIVNEEADSQLIPSTPAASASPQHTGTQWIPVEEHTFEFEEESVATLPDTVFSDQPATTVESSGFGEIAFEDEVPVQKAPVVTAPEPEPESAASIFTVPEPDFSAFEVTATTPEPETSVFEVPVYEPAPAVVEFSEPTVIPPVVVPAPATSNPGTLSEDQLRAAIAAASKEVIERIVWEVVPDLAEALIRDAIRKIKEGV
jgi:CheY-like chemotaxis protein